MQPVEKGVPQGSVSAPLFTCYLLPLELMFAKLNVNYCFGAGDMADYFVYNVTQEKFDSTLGTLQKRLNGAKIRLNTKKTEYINIARKSSMVSDIQLQMDSKFSNMSFWVLF